jgi:cytochrome c oxidase cbb3-type subunit 3
MRGLRHLPLALLLILPSCSKDKDSREWVAQDHDQPGQRPAAAATEETNSQDDAYKKACAPCHGFDGKGDGPMGRSLRVADLSSVAWQQRVSDEDIAEVILKGRGQMPAFKLPPEELDAMVKKVRSFRR